MTHAGTTIVRSAGNISSPVFDRTGHLIATADNQGNVNLWRVRVGGELTSYFPYGLPAQALDDAGSSILVAGENGLVERWSTMEGSATAFDLGDVRLTSIATLPDGHVAVGDEFGQIHVLDRSGQQLSTWQAHQGAIQTVLAGTGGQLVSAGADPVIKTWDPNTGALLEMFQGHTNDVRDLVLNSEKNTVWSAGADGLLLGHGLQANTVVTLTANVPLLAAAVSQDERYIAAADVTARIHFWNRGNGQHWTQRTSKPVHTMVFDASGRLITGNESGEIEFWNPDQRTTMSLQAHPQSRSVRDLILFEGGRFLVSLADDGQVKVWPLQLSDLLNLACQRAGDLRMRNGTTCLHSQHPSTSARRREHQPFPP
ncbi:MAG: hypothetical protein IPK16_20660 [Anaerolineales bacterium]|nr:hypothetical protein [Anaerolineales bacterium]